jgi:hypothetical protein
MGEAGQFINKSWLSVLGNTTRDAHADLDGVMADADGLWDLNGVKIPWPGHVSLPASDRCNCQCTIVTEFGVGAPEAELEVIRQEMERSFEIWEKYNPGQPRDSSGRWSSGGGGGAAVSMGSDGRGVVETGADGRTSYGGVSEDEWNDWAYYSHDINAARDGSLKAGSISEQGEKLSQRDVDAFKETGDRIQLAASSNALKQTQVFRGESYESESEVLLKYKPSRKKTELQGITSTAIAESAAMDYATSDASGPVKVLVRYSNPNGIRGIQTAPMGLPSNEAVLPKGDLYRITRTFKRDDGVFVVDMYSTEKHGLPRVDASPPGKSWEKYNPGQPRDSSGRWASGGGGSAGGWSGEKAH